LRTGKHTKLLSSACLESAENQAERRFVALD
jgi:hypothetical protein